MAAPDLSLAVVFDAGAKGERTATDVFASALEEAKAFKAVCAAAKVMLPQLHWHAAAEEVARRIRELLDVPMPRVLMHGWQLRKDMRAYCDRDKYPPDTTATVTLSKHSVSWSQRPKVRLRVNGAPIGSPLEFELEATVTLELCTISICSGRVIGLDTGKFTVEGSVSLEDCQIVERRLLDVPLKGHLNFGEGLPLCGEARGEYPSSRPAARPVSR